MASDDAVPAFLSLQERGTSIQKMESQENNPKSSQMEAITLSGDKAVTHEH